MKRNRKVLIDTLKQSRGGIAALIVGFMMTAVVFYLYRLPPEPFVYTAVLVVFLEILLLMLSFLKEKAKAEERETMIRTALTECSLPSSDSLAEEDYQTVIRELRDEVLRLQNEYTVQKQEETDYYTAWVHQIKTPIAVMRMELGGSDLENARHLEAELFRIEQYVDMVLTYIRLGDNYHDLLIKNYSLDEVIRESIHKFAPQFVLKKLRLDFDGTDVRIITDKKWFSCILEQILSNAIKYTSSGGITITIEEKRLKIMDTGIGIATEDIPRIFEKGFTGINGRYDKKASGLGLYLCRKAADLLQIPLSVESVVGEGSAFILDLEEKITEKKE